MIKAPRQAGVRTSGPGQAGGLDAFAADDLGLSFYLEPPSVEVSVREFEEFTRDRLKVLHTFDRLCSYDVRLDAIPEMRPKMAKELADAHLALASPNKAWTTEIFASQKADFVRRDAISHYALRLAFCKARDAREWFVNQEQRLFVLRFDGLRPEAQEAFLAASGVECKRVDPTTKMKEGKGRLLEFLQQTTPGAKIWREDGKPPVADPNFYEMPFTDVPPSLIAGRRVVLQQGRAFVPSCALKLILAKRFKEHLIAGLDTAFHGLPVALSDPRVGGFLHHLQDYGLQLLVAPNKGSTEDVGERLSIENFEELMARSFPPCMRRLVEKQRESKKHLKHAGRLQLRPFLKECGFTIEESFKWWKQELMKDSTIDAASYEKHYTYDVEHAYGKKGHLQGQNAFGCPKIIGFPDEAVGQVHGCPFRHLDMQVLKQQLHKWHVPEYHVLEMEKLIGHGKHFQLACVEYFKATHAGHSGEGLGNTPGEFFRESCRYHTKKLEKEKGDAASSPAKA